MGDGWLGNSSITLNWGFTVDGNEASVRLDGDREFNRNAFFEFSLYDHTSDALIASYSSEGAVEAFYDNELLLSDGHNYSLLASARTIDFGGGDPVTLMAVTFNNAEFVSVPDSGHSVLCCGIALLSLAIWWRADGIRTHS